MNVLPMSSDAVHAAHSCHWSIPTLMMPPSNWMSASDGPWCCWNPREVLILTTTAGYLRLSRSPFPSSRQWDRRSVRPGPSHGIPWSHRAAADYSRLNLNTLTSPRASGGLGASHEPRGRKTVSTQARHWRRFVKCGFRSHPPPIFAGFYAC